MLKKENKRAIASLFATLLLGGIIVEISLISLLMVTVVERSNYGVRLSQDTYAAASSGIDDGILMMVRDKNGPYSSRTFSVGSASVTVTYCKNSYTAVSSCDTASSGTNEITAISIAGLKQRKIVALLGVDAYTGLIVVQSIKEKAL